MKKTLKRLCTGFLALATVVTALPTTPVHAESKQYWTESKERVGIVEKVMNDGSIGSTFNEGHLTVEGEDAYCIDINTDFKNGYKTRADASTRMSADQISDVALSIEYVKQYTDSHSGISKNHAYLLRQLVVWQRLSVHLGWQCDNVRASYDEIPKATQDEVFVGAKAFVKENKGRYECGGYIYSGEGQELGQFWAKLNVGNAKLQKVSSNTSITDGNGNYSIAGATYGVFSDKDCTKLTVEETKAPNGYLLDGAYMQAGDKSEQIKGLYITQITEDGDLAVLSGSNQFSVFDKVIRGGVKIQKRDLETGDTKPQGSATLKDTAFDIISLNDNSVLVEGKLYKKNEVVKTIRTDIEGIASTSADLLPYGKFRIVESEAPNGYLTDGAKPIDFTITENGKIVDLTDEAHSIYNQIKRGDIEGVKIGAGTHKRLADVPFRITSKTTGENHVVVTDDNGQFSTSADWASHKHNTNAGKTSEDGVWFGTSEPDDSKGALPYDTYIIEEMRCDSNKDFELIPPFEIVVSRNNLVIDLGTLTDEYEKEISIHTTATSKDGEKTILAGKEVTIVDTVKLDGLTKGTKYQLKGWQMLKEENAELIIDGKRVENDYTFVADDEAMKVEIAYTFNASELGGKNLVTFEELYDLSNPDEPVKVAEHKDIDDDGQTVLITERIIKIHTTATDKDGNKEIEAGKDVTIIDTVTLEGLEVGTQYKLVGWQMLKEENAELLINGKRVENDYSFIADKENMKVEIIFTFDASSLGGKQLVTFEELYDVSNPDEPKKVTEHKDIEDDGQTVTIKEVPETPEEPEKPETPQTPDTPKKTDSPKTGDNTNLMAFIVMLIASGAGLAGTYLYKRRKVKKS
ncbi:VaFE repeat-containing surface-anchored protein [Ruminococcus sp.]|uniref:VaFE repeat-containing surface-anchored protein n=1 Tax=Ruminococcus sp. TaxID=41978 RepID=UPI003528699B